MDPDYKLKDQNYTGFLIGDDLKNYNIFFSERIKFSKKMIYKNSRKYDILNFKENVNCLKNICNKNMKEKNIKKKNEKYKIGKDIKLFNNKKKSNKNKIFLKNGKSYDLLKLPFLIDKKNNNLNPSPTDLRLKNKRGNRYSHSMNLKNLTNAEKLNRFLF